MDLDFRGQRRKNRNVANERPGPHVGTSRQQRAPARQMQIYQPDTRGVVFMPAYKSDLGAGVLRSTDYGKTWTRVGIAMEQAAVFGTPKRVYAMYAWPCGSCKLDPALQSAPQPGISGWGRMLTPP